MSTTRIVAVGAATAMAGVAATVWIARALLQRQAAIARRRIGKPLGEEAMDADRIWRGALGDDPVDLLMVGDSIAAGLGAQHRKETLGARLSKGLAHRVRRPVRLRTAAVVGAESSMVAAQLDALPDDYRPDIAVIIVGGNDITHRVPVSTSIRHLERAVLRLRSGGAAVIVGTCPDLGALRAVPQPLRTLGSRLSRQLAEAQAVAAEGAGARAVSLRNAVGPVFISNPDEMFSLDRFHPSALGYRRTAEALLPAIIDALAATAPMSQAPTTG